MIRTKIFLLICMGTALFSCGKIDNYATPNGGLQGTLTDMITKEGLQTEQPNGFSIKLFETGGSINSPIITQGKPDGTYRNSFIFQNEYKVVASEGAFFPVDTVVVKIGKQEELNFDVTPFLAVASAAVTTASGSVTANYSIQRSRVGDKIIERKTLVSEVPTVNNVTFNFKKETNLSAITDDDILATPYSDTIDGLTAGKTYYVRIGVLTNNSLKRYNYSKVFTITAQ